MRSLSALCLTALLLVISSIAHSKDSESDKVVLVCDTWADRQIDYLKNASLSCFSSEGKDYPYRTLPEAMAAGWRPFNVSTGNAATGSYEREAGHQTLTRNIYSKIVILLDK